MSSKINDTKRWNHNTVASQPQDLPPIITYPEFLMHTKQSPSSLLTGDNLLKAAYLLSGAFVAAYATSTYVVRPMLTSLHSARHSLLEGSLQNIQALNEKLEGVVSAVPHQASALESKSGREPHPYPTEPSNESWTSQLYSRETGTQTTPGVSRSPSLSAIQTAETQAALENEHIPLENIRKVLNSILTLEEQAQTETCDVKDGMNDFEISMRTLLLTNSRGSKLNVSGEVGSDVVEKAKAEIKSIKGVLLSARNFPASGGRSMG